MAVYTTIDNPELYFQNKLHTGNGTAIGSGGQAITLDGDVDMAPNFVWIKNREDAHGHQLYDTVRGVTKRLSANNTGGTSTDTEGLTTFGTNGFTLGNDEAVNKNTETYVSWCWKANGTGSTNTDGNNPNTETVSANTTSGFSIIKYTGTDTGGQTIGHGLGVKPKVFICKNISETDSWVNWQDTTNDGTADVRMNFNQTAADRNDHFITFGTSTITLPSTSDNGWNGSSDDLIAYCFVEKQGFSKFGSFEGNNNADGSFVYLGFKPKWVMIKDMDSQGTVGGTVATSWGIWDSKRMPNNPASNPLWASHAGNETIRGNNSSANTGGSDGNGLGGFIFIDMLSNGFKCRVGAAELNGSNTYAYMAFAEAPFVNSNGVPCNAK